MKRECCGCPAGKEIIFCSCKCHELARVEGYTEEKITFGKAKRESLLEACEAKDEEAAADWQKKAKSGVVVRVM